MTIVLDGKRLAQEITEELKKKVGQIATERQIPSLAIVVCGNNPESILYISMKRKKCAEIGIPVQLHHLPEESTTEKVVALVNQLNTQVGGILIQLPLPAHLNTEKIVNALHPSKDVDGLSAFSSGQLTWGDESSAPATPKAILEILRRYTIPLQGREITIINHSPLIGKPLAIMLLNRGATVTVCHEFTRNLAGHTRQADILITAVGKPQLIRAEMVKEGAIIIDAGISRNNDRVQGDVCYEEVFSKVSQITPVPGGIGPVTVVMLLQSLLSRCSAASDTELTSTKL